MSRIRPLSGPPFTALRRAALLGLPTIVGLAGCTARPPGLVMAAHERGGASWLLGQRGELSLAQEFAGRRAWPALDDGYQVEVYSESLEFRVNDQSFYDPLGGGFFQSSETFQHRVTIR